MSRRTWSNDLLVTSQGLVMLSFSFLTNNTSDPLPSSFRGCGGLTGTDSGAGVPNSGPSAVRSITRTGVGAYAITLQDGYRYVSAAHVSIDDAADTLIARNAAPASEGSGAETPVTAAVVVRAAATGTATESTGRRISCTFILKNSGNGT